MKILIIDNYDSFTYNLYQYIGEILTSRKESFVLDVFRNDEIGLDEIKKRKYDKVIISPGPGDPSDKNYFGVSAEVIMDLGRSTPVLGVCLGMQGIVHYFGGKVIKANIPMHGKTSIIKHNGKGIFHNIPQEVEVMRYHSLIADAGSFPECLEVTAYVSFQTGKSKIKNQISKSEGVEIMGIRHRSYPVEGVQFHPESFATEGGKIILENFIEK